MPSRWADVSDWLVDPQIVTMPVGGESRWFFVERTRADSVHACTVDDIVRVLGQLDPQDLDELEWIVLRQPTRKSQTLERSWGSQRVLKFGSNYGQSIVLEAVPATKTLRFSRHLDPFWQAELDRYRQGGLEVIERRRGFEITLDVAGAREVLLYRTLLHEVGHHVDYLQKVSRPYDAEIGDFGELLDKYYERPRVEREVFAHRFADRMGAELRSRGTIPFERMDQPERLRALGLRVEDFHLDAPGDPDANQA